MIRHLLAIEDQLALEEPVAAVLAVRLGDIEALDVGRVAADPVGEEIGVVVEVPLVEREAFSSSCLTRSSMDCTLLHTPSRLLLTASL